MLVRLLLIPLLAGPCLVQTAPRAPRAVRAQGVDPLRAAMATSNELGGPFDTLIAQLEDAATPLELEPGGHGTVGLTTHEALFDPNGQPHLLLWDTTDAAASASVRLVFVPDDQESGRGWEARSPAFGLADGLPEPVEVEWIEP